MSKFPLVGCADCNHGMLHHNPDRRMKSGYGKCVCGNCKKYKDRVINQVTAYTTTTFGYDVE